MTASLIEQLEERLDDGEDGAALFMELRQLDYIEPVKAAERWLRNRLGKTFMAPMRGFQEDFVNAETTVVIGGGNKGPGKSHALIYGPTKHREVPGFTSVIFREEATQLRKPGGLLTKAAAIHLPLGASLNKADMKMTYPSGAEYALAHVNGATVDRHQGIEYADIGLDEGTHFVYGVFTTLLSCCRSTCGVPAQFRITCNPDISSWLFFYVRPWVDNGTSGFTERHELYGSVKFAEALWFARIPAGEVVPEAIADNLLALDDIPALDGEEAHQLAWVSEGTPGAISITYIPGSLDDNLYLSGTTYEDQLKQLPEHERQKFLHGNWMSQAKPGQYFRRAWFNLKTLSQMQPSVIWRSWDTASRRVSKGNKRPDYTAGGLYLEYKQGGKMFYDVCDMERLRGTPEDVDNLIQATYLRDLEWVERHFPGTKLCVLYEVEKGGSGAIAFSACERYVLSAEALTKAAGRPMKRAELYGYKVRGTKAERAEAPSKAAQDGRLALLKGAPFVETFVREAEKFTGEPNVFDDQVVTIANLMDWREQHVFEPGSPIMGTPKPRRHRRRR